MKSKSSLGLSSLDMNFKSAPAQKLRPDPVITKTLTSLFLDTSFRALSNSTSKSKLRAFNVSGLFKVILAIGGFFNRMIFEYKLLSPFFSDSLKDF